MKNVPARLYLRFQIWSSSAAGDNPAGYGWIDDYDKAVTLMERMQREVDENSVSKQAKRL